MKHLKTIKYLSALVVLALWIPGCATQSVNPPQARANTGYVDFYSDSSPDLSWEVARFDDSAKSFKTVFSDLEPPKDGVLRLAFAPGHYRLRVTVMNRVVQEPGLLEAEVKDGMVTPVRVELIEAGTTTVQSKRTTRGGTAYGRYGRRTKIDSSESTAYQMKPLPQPPQPYRLKEQMPYTPKPGN